MAKALVQLDGRVAQIVANGEEFPVHSDLQWINADETITTRHTWNGASFDSPPAPEPEVKRVSSDSLADLLVTKGVISRTDVDGL